MIDLTAVRADTPATQDIIHFNNAGASLMPRPVYQAVRGHLDLENAVGGYEAERRAAPELDAFYSEFAGLLNARPDEIAFVENATRAWDMAFYGLDLKPGDRILTHESEYASNYLALLQQAKRRGLFVDLVPSDEHGQIDVSAISGLVTEKTRLIAVTHVPTQGGLVNPAAEVGSVAHAHGLIFMLDACQSAGQIALDVEKLGCDVLSGTGRKFLRGPRGTGFLYVRKSLIETMDPPFVDLLAARWTDDQDFAYADGARRFETWESNVAGRVGLVAAVRYARDIGMADIEARVVMLAEALRRELAAIPGVSVTDRGLKKSGIVTFTKAGTTPNALYEALRARAINMSVSPLSYARLDLGRRGFDSLARASVHYFNTEDEIDRFVEAVKAV